MVASGGGAGCVRYHCSIVKGQYVVVLTIDGMDAGLVDQTFKTPREAIDHANGLNAR